MGHSDGVLKHIVKKRGATTSAQDSVSKKGASFEPPFFMPSQTASPKNGASPHPIPAANHALDKHSRDGEHPSEPCFNGFVRNKGHKLKAEIVYAPPFSDEKQDRQTPSLHVMSLNQVRSLARARKEQGYDTTRLNLIIHEMQRQIVAAEQKHREQQKKHREQQKKTKDAAPTAARADQSARTVEPQKEYFTSSYGAPTVHMIFNDKAFNDRLNTRGTYICLYVKSDKPTQALNEPMLRAHIDHLVNTVKPAFDEAMEHRFVLAFPAKSNPERFAAILDEARSKHGIASLIIGKRLPPSHINEFSADKRPPKAPRASGDHQKTVNELRRHIITIKHQL